MTHTNRSLLAILAIASGALAACSTSDFSVVTRLDKLRVLAVRAEPVNPAADTSTVIEPLVYTPAGQTTTYAWSWCPILGFSADGFSCPLTDADVQALATALGLAEAPPPLVLGTDPTQSYKNVFPAPVLAAVCENGFSGIKLNCDGGFPIRVKVVVTSGDTAITATTIVRLPIDDVPGNANPVITGIEAVIDGQTLAVDQTGQVVVPRLVETELHALVDPTQSEAYAGKDVDDNPITLHERLVVSWFTEQGDISDAQTAFIDGKTMLADALINKLEPLTLEDDPADQARLIVVLRDNRGGVAWTSGLVRLGAQP